MDTLSTTALMLPGGVKCIMRTCMQSVATYIRIFGLKVIYYNTASSMCIASVTPDYYIYHMQLSWLCRDRW